MCTLYTFSTYIDKKEMIKKEENGTLMRKSKKEKNRESREKEVQKSEN